MKTKSMDEYIADVYKKYEELQEKNEVYQLIEIKEPQPFNKKSFTKIAACFLALLTAGGGITYHCLRTEIEKGEEYKYVAVEKNENAAVYIEYLKVDNKNTQEYLEKIVKNSDTIAIVENVKENFVNSYIKYGRIQLITNGEMKVNTILKGNDDLEGKVIFYSKNGGKILIDELENEIEYDWKTWETDLTGRELSEDEKMHTYFKQTAKKSVEIEDGKEYLVFLNYNKEKECYEIANIIYGIMEYDPTTNQVKDIDTNTFVDLEWEVPKEEN